MRQPPYLGRAVLAGIILLLSLLAFKRYLPYVGSSVAPSEPPAIVLEMRNTYFVGLNHKGKIWSLKANKVQIGRNRYLTTLSGITEGKIYDGGKSALRMKAGRAVYNSLVGDLTMDQGIDVTGMNGQRLTASGADWNSATSTLRSKGRVKYEDALGKTSTDSVLVDMKSKEITMWNVSGSVDLSKTEAGQHAL